ncbi:MAG: chloramphenicol acetyltransferase [Oscillospiraceae bacterium]|jgi:chloramphenicol O-acetyltransferase type A|nr:chloramphenicol acetyltransferase [Oscillospiraceae bacterium]
MFTAIDYDTWDRKEIYERWLGFTYTVTVEMDVTDFLRQLREKNRKFYPAVCWIIAKTVNDDEDFRFARINGQLGQFDSLNPNYTLRRKRPPHLFTHMETQYSEDFEEFYQAFLADKIKAEDGDSVYYYKNPRINTIDISITPNIIFQSISYDRPPQFLDMDAAETKFTPFVTVGKYHQVDERVVMPVTAAFHHCVNDGAHVEKFFSSFAENLNVGV